jgi:cell division septation protein DedD
MTPPRPVATPKPAAPLLSAGNSGAWRVQLGAFGVLANAQAMWDHVKSRPEVAGRTKLLISAGAVTKLQAGGFASEEAARAACSRLSAAGISCLATRN